MQSEIKYQKQNVCHLNDLGHLYDSCSYSQVATFLSCTISEL